MTNIILTVTASIFLAGFIYFMYENQTKKNAKKLLEQKTKEDREQKIKVDRLLDDYPTFSRYRTNEMFQDTELGYELDDLNHKVKNQDRADQRVCKV